MIELTMKSATTFRMMALHSLFNIGLILLLYFKSSEKHYLFLGWNLFLAWLPLFMALYIRLLPFKKGGVRFYVLLGFWLLFFPNAPYIITDLIHLNERYNPARWYDILLLFSSALNGLLLGFYSLFLVHNKIRTQLSELVSWCIVILFALLSAYGIYLGRALRWNSWDLFVQPIPLLRDSILELSSYAAMSMTFGFFTFIITLYYIFKNIINHEVSPQKP